MCNNISDDCKCISEILSIINILQQNAECGDSCLDTCDRGFLGCSVSSISCNTRPVMLYTCGNNGVPLNMPISKSPTETTTSTIFRVEKVDGCCATFRVLVPNTDTTETYPYEATNSFFTVNLNCVCILRCLQDTYVECV